MSASESASKPFFAPVDSRQSFPDLEQEVLGRWREGDIFRRSVEQRSAAPIWSFYEGPPTANGRPGSHHVLSRVFKDIYPRYRTMRGYRVPRKAGWDCHGLPVELEVEKEIGVTSKEQIEAFGIAEFNQRCRESVFRYVDDWNRLTERIGFWVDLDDPYVTMDDSYIESVWWSLRELWDRDLLYEGHKVVPYCPRCGTALSSHEVALGYHDVEDPSVFVRMPVTSVEGTGAQLEPGDSLLIWTTTPWTLISNAAIAVGPDIEYVRARLGDEVLIVAAERLTAVLGEDAEVLDRFAGSALTGTRYEPPFDYVTDFGPLSQSVLEGDFVTTTDGTGLVHTALAFGEDDYRLGEQHGMTLQNPVKLDGTYDDRVTPWAGRFVKDADPEIVEALRESGRLLRATTFEHAYPHCWRCDTPLLYYAKSSWYVATSTRREGLLGGNEQIDWHPQHIKEGRFGRWLENNVDWALSRDRYWGTPLPIWECEGPDCDERFCAGSIADLRERGGEVPDDLHRPHIDEVVLRCEACDGEMRRVQSVIDTWYDSGAMPFAQFHYPFEGAEEFRERFPADFICEAIDQTRGWFYTLHAESTLLFDQPSYRACVCLGLILDPEGQKMSKSRGNVVEPWEVIDEHGADAFRWYYLTSQQPWAGYRFSSEAVGESVRQFMLTLWNTYSFFVMYANASDWKPSPEDGGEASGKRAGLRPETIPTTSPPTADTGALLDAWARSRLELVKGEVIERMDAFDCTSAGRAIAAYVDELSNWYVRLSRRRFWAGEPDALETLRHCLLETSRMLAPFTPFLADAVHSNLAGPRGADSVHLTDLTDADPARRNQELELGMEAAQRTVELGRAARAKAKVKLRQPLAKAIVVASEAERAAIERLEALVTTELNVKALEYVSEESELATYTVKPDFRALGPRFGPKMPLVAAAVAALDPEAVSRAVRRGGEIGISIDGTEHALAAGEVQLVLSPLEGYEVSSEAGHAVALATELDDELRQEGLAREIVHAVQNARKAEGLDIADRIELTLGGDEALLAAARAHQAYVADETLATAVAYGSVGGEATKIDGAELRIAVVRSG